MLDWIDNALGPNSIPYIMKVIHIGDFIQVIYENSPEQIYGGFITTLATDAPAIDKGENKIHVIGLSTSHPNHSSEEKVLWAHKIKMFSF